MKIENGFQIKKSLKALFFEFFNEMNQILNVFH